MVGAAVEDNMISKVHEFILDWDEFKEIVEENNVKSREEYELIAYRGHANHQWELKPTL